jgi:hypothetical protein
MSRNSREIKPHHFEGSDIQKLFKRVMEHGEEIVDDELTKGRIRTIYTQVKYGTKSPQEVADYYGLPVQLIKDIRDEKIFRKITSESYEED